VRGLRTATPRSLRVLQRSSANRSLRLLRPMTEDAGIDLSDAIGAELERKVEAPDDTSHKGHHA
jgi:hypothetical protein